MRLCELVLAAFAVGCGAAGPTLDVGGQARSYVLHVPPAAARPMPLVVALHGGGGTAHSMERLTGFDALADREGFAVVYPDALDGHWNDGRHDNDAPQDADDVGFVRTLIDQLVASGTVDPARVFATGISNGGIMSYRLACELSDRIAAIAPVVGNLSADLAPRCRPSRPVSVLAMNGTSDPFVPFGGGQVHVFKDRGAVLSVAESVATFARFARCASDPSVAWEPDRDPTDGTRVRGASYVGCAPGLGIEELDLDGAGHTWPGGRQYLPVGLIGRVSHEFSATERMWQFFAAHGR